MLVFTVVTGWEEGEACIVKSEVESSLVLNGPFLKRFASRSGGNFGKQIEPSQSKRHGPPMPSLPSLRPISVNWVEITRNDVTTEPHLRAPPQSNLRIALTKLTGAGNTRCWMFDTFLFDFSSPSSIVIDHQSPRSALWPLYQDEVCQRARSGSCPRYTCTAVSNLLNKPLINAQNGESSTLTTKLGRSTSKLLLVL
jgi:hypothetical protein